jgi:hypothetical protein
MSSSAGGADSFERFAGALGEDWYSYPGVETSELTLRELESGISMLCGGGGGGGDGDVAVS